MPAPCCLRWAGALPRPPECDSPRGWCPVTRRSMGGLMCVFVIVIMLTVPPVLGDECALRNRVPMDGASRALLSPQVVEAVLEKVAPGVPVYEAVFRVTKVYKKYRGPRRLKKRRTVSLPFRSPGGFGSGGGGRGRRGRFLPRAADCIVTANLTARRKYFLFLSGATDRKKPLRNVFPPLPSTKRAKRRIKSIVCEGCAKAPSVGRLRDDSVVRGQSANLTCTFEGSPAPAISWLKNGKVLDPSRSRDIRIHTRRVRIRPRIRRPRRRSRHRENRRKMNDNEGSNVQRRRKSRRKKPSRGRAKPVRVISTLSFRSSADSDGGSYSCVGRSVLGEASARAGLTVVQPLDPGIVYPCPYDSYCLNGGTCMFFKHFGEFVCQCAEGFKGQRCQEKEVFPTFRDHNCRGSFSFQSPPRSLRCPRNQPVFLWEILQQSLAGHKQKVSPWSKAQHLAWSPTHTTTGRSWPRSDTRSPVTPFSHLRHPYNIVNPSNFSTQNFSFIPQSGHRRKGQLMPHSTSLGTTFALPPRLNVSLNGQLGNKSNDSSLFSPLLSSLVNPTLTQFGGIVFNNTQNNLNYSTSNSHGTLSPNTIPKNYSGHPENYDNIFPTLEDLQPFRNELVPNRRLSAKAFDPTVHPHHNGRKIQRNKLRKKVNNWPLKPPSAHSNFVSRQSYIYPTFITPTPNDLSQSQL